MDKISLTEKEERIIKSKQRINGNTDQSIDQGILCVNALFLIKSLGLEFSD